jgi:hypothetical protein
MFTTATQPLGRIPNRGSGLGERLPLSPTDLDTSRTLCIPFASLKPYDFLAEDPAAHVYGISAAVVLKVPIQYNNPNMDDITDHAAGIVSLEHENAIYEVLNERKF